MKWIKQADRIYSSLKKEALPKEYKMELYEFDELSEDIKDNLIKKHTDQVVEMDLEGLANQLNEGIMTEEEYYDIIGTSKSYAESTPWFVPSVYYDNHEEEVDEEVMDILNSKLYDESGKIIKDK